MSTALPGKAQTINSNVPLPPSFTVHFLALYFNYVHKFVEQQYAQFLFCEKCFYYKCKVSKQIFYCFRLSRPSSFPFPYRVIPLFKTQLQDSPDYPLIVFSSLPFWDLINFTEAICVLAYLVNPLEQCSATVLSQIVRYHVTR